MAFNSSSLKQKKLNHIYFNKALPTRVRSKSFIEGFSNNHVGKSTALNNGYVWSHKSIKQNGALIYCGLM